MIMIGCLSQSDDPVELMFTCATVAAKLGTMMTCY